MPTPENIPVAAPVPRDYSREDRAVAAELQFLLIALAFVIVMLLAGVPGRDEKQAGDGSAALQLGWAERHAADVAAQQPAAPAER